MVHFPLVITLLRFVVGPTEIIGFWLDEDEETVLVTLLLVTPSFVAVILVVPAAIAVNTPEVDIVPIDVLVEDQVTEEVTSAVELSEYVPVAVNCAVALTFKVVWGVEIEMDDKVTLVPPVPPVPVVVVTGFPPPPPPQPVRISVPYRHSEITNRHWNN